jgi:putative heme-binding domain-containing protein
MHAMQRTVWCVALAIALVDSSQRSAVAQTRPLEPRLLRQSAADLAKEARAEGDPVQGAVLFYQPQLSCTKCHTCGETNDESPLGPDLSRLPTGTRDEDIIEALLTPSKSVRKGYESVTVVRSDGVTVSGLLVEDRDSELTLRDASANGVHITISKGDIEDHKIESTSIMPAGLMNQLTDRQQFFDLAAFLIECAEFGPARARSLRPDPAVIDPPLPAYEADLDHAGIISGLNEAAYKRGEKLYARLCASCHGTENEPGSMPTSLPFASGKFRNGSDPWGMYRTLTRGYGMMAAQTGLVPRQKYDVIHYIREAFLKPLNPSQYVAADTAYLGSLPKGASRGPIAPAAEPWRDADYGPTLSGTFEIGADGSNIAYKGTAVRLDAGEGGVAKGKFWVVFEHDTLRMAAGWSGTGFIDWNGINFNGRHEIHPRIVGEVGFETAAGPGWSNPDNGSFEDPRIRGRDGKPYGPLPRTWGKFRGLYHAGDRAVFAYTVGDIEVLESPGLVDSQSAPVFTRTFHIGPRAKPMTLRVLRHPERNAIVNVERPNGSTACVTIIGRQNRPVSFAGAVGQPNAAQWSLADDGHLLLQLPAGEDTLRFTVWAGRLPSDNESKDLAARISNMTETTDLSALTAGGTSKWNQTFTTKIEPGANDRPFAVDCLSIPTKNPWSAQFRLTGLDFLSNGAQLVACTWDGDVWQISGLDRADGILSWRRIASGLFQPLGLKIVDGVIYVSCRDQIAILRDLNGDGETDFYECFNSDHQVTEHFHEFAMGLQTDADGNFLYAKAARHAKPAIVPQHGTLLRVSKDGSNTEIIATGFRAPNGVCVNPDGTLFVTDQEGHWVPKNRINLVSPGMRFYGNMFAYTDVTDISDAAQEEPVCWITNHFDRSPGELVWVSSPTWGGMDGALLNLSYGHGKVYVVAHERIGEVVQGGMTALPLPPFPTGVMRGRFHPNDGNLYVCGMYSWAGNQQAPGGLYRLRATGKPAFLPVGYHVRRGEIALTFSDCLRPDSVEDARNFGLKVWDLVRSEEYGSPHVNEQTLTVTSAKLSADRRTITLSVPQLRSTRGLELWYSIHGADDSDVSGLFHGSINYLGN